MPQSYTRIPHPRNTQRCPNGKYLYKCVIWVYACVTIVVLTLGQVAQEHYQRLTSSSVGLAFCCDGLLKTPDDLAIQAAPVDLREPLKLGLEFLRDTQSVANLSDHIGESTHRWTHDTLMISLQY